MVDELFLDTTMHFEKFSVDENRREKTADFLSRYGFKGTSSYTFLEFKGSFLQDIVYLYRHLEKEGLAGVYAKLPGLGKWQSRKLQVVCDHLIRFCADNRYDVSDILIMIENAVDEYWDRLREVDDIQDGTGCVRAKERPVKRRTTIDVSIARCHTVDIKCKIHKFFEENKELFEKINDEIDKLTPEFVTSELRRFQEIYKRCKNSATSLCSDDVCRKIGDMLIAVDGRNYSNIASTNKKEFDIICKALSRKLVSPFK